MIDVENVVSTFTGKLPKGIDFQPSNIDLNNYFPVEQKFDTEEDSESVAIDEQEESNRYRLLSPVYPQDAIVAIDSTSFCLGHIPEGLVGAIRLSVIIKTSDSLNHSLEHYGPYLVAVTNQNKTSIYRSLYKAVYGKTTEGSAPDCAKMIDRVRNLLERYVQFEVARSHSNSIILLDGSLIGGTVANPGFFIKQIIDYAIGNENSLVAISKSTGLTLQSTKRSILSLLDGATGPCYISGVKDRISQNKERYLGDIYIAKLTPLGESFRIDIPRSTPEVHSEILRKVAGLAGEYGYPEELKLAHMTCVHSWIEILELQASAIALHGLVLKEELRKKLFPL